MKIRKGQALEVAKACGKYPVGGMVQEEVIEHLTELTRKVEGFDVDTNADDF
jgi:hypothetical protein